MLQYEPKKRQKVEPIIVFDKVSFSYPVFADESEENEEAIFEINEKPELPPVLDEVSFEIYPGEFVAVLGHNGSGKSTLAKHMNGILLPTSGTVTAAGMDTDDEDNLLDIRRTVGMVFQNPDNQLVSTVVEEDVAFALENLGVDPPEIRKRVDEALHAVSMYEYREHAPHKLSGGQKQRVAIAGVIAMRPKCIVLDEPTAMLDPQGRQEVLDIIKQLSKKGIAIVLITHHMSEAADADRVIVMSKGDILLDAPPREIFRQVDTLLSVGLTIPGPTALVYELKISGENITETVLTAEECAKALFNWLEVPS